MKNYLISISVFLLLSCSTLEPFKSTKTGNIKRIFSSSFNVLNCEFIDEIIVLNGVSSQIIVEFDKKFNNIIETKTTNDTLYVNTERKKYWGNMKNDKISISIFLPNANNSMVLNSIGNLTIEVVNSIKLNCNSVGYMNLIGNDKSDLIKLKGNSIGKIDIGTPCKELHLDINNVGVVNITSIIDFSVIKASSLTALEAKNAKFLNLSLFLKSVANTSNIYVTNKLNISALNSNFINVYGKPTSIDKRLDNQSFIRFF